ncbi:hypothetical protein AiwAL_10370 [Acidiphilium sp. AL]|nr:hypothetical protein [Acidiphilium sp. AL]
MRQAGLFGLLDHLKRLSACGDPLEELGRIVDFDLFRPTLAGALAYGDGAKGGRPPYDPVAMFKPNFDTLTFRGVKKSPNSADFSAAI